MRRSDKEKYLAKCSYIIRYLALETWKRLPITYKDCIDLEDLVQDAKIYTWHNVIPSYRSTSKMSITTFVYERLRKHLINQTIYYRAQKRQVKNLPDPVTVPVLLLEAYEIYEAVYKISSPELQQVLGSALGVPKAVAEAPEPLLRFRLTGNKWHSVRAEFKEILGTVHRRYGQFTLGDAELLQKFGDELLFQTSLCE